MVFEFNTSLYADPVRISVRPGSLTIGTDDSLSFDCKGRLLTASHDSIFYKRGLNHRVLAKHRKWSPGRSERIRRDLTEDEKDELIRRSTETVSSLLPFLPAEFPGTARAWLERIVSWSPEAYRLDAERYNQIYSPVGILPPDQYMALVLQATHGCHYNKCTFCGFYREIPFHVKNPEPFREHIEAVRDFAGTGPGLRRSIFLADANALVTPQRRLLPIFETINESFNVAPAGLSREELARWKAENPDGITGIYSFIDAFTGTRKTREEFEELAALGLRRIYIGMESGHVPLLNFLRKPSMPDDVRDLVETAKSAGVNVGVIVMLGIGGETYSHGHVTDTVRLLEQLNLSQGDLLYLSEYVEEPGTEYGQLAEEAGIRPLTYEEIRRQEMALRSCISPTLGCKTATYDIREFIY